MRKFIDSIFLMITRRLYKQIENMRPVGTTWLENVDGDQETTTFLLIADRMFKLFTIATCTYSELKANLQD